MSRKSSKESSVTDDLINALRDDRVLDALGSIYEAKLQAALKDLLQTVTDLKHENEQKDMKINCMQQRIDDLEAYNRRDNLLISGLPIESYSEAATVGASGDGNREQVDTRTSTAESSYATEQAALKMFNTCLNVKVSEKDISVAHRLPSKNKSQPPVVIVRFTNRKARDDVYNARRKLRSVASSRIFINEDLAKTTAELFQQARKLVRSKQLHSTWTRNGSLFIKSSEDSRPQKIKNSGELPVLRSSE